MTSPLQLLDTAPDVYDALQKLKRTGWVNRGVEHPESVKEHTEALLLLAKELSEFLTDEEQNGLLDMLEVHDWPEVIHGDEVILELEPNQRQALKAIKFQKEHDAMKRLCLALPDGEALLALWLRFETSEDPAADFARQLDKYQAVEKALEYEQTQGIALFEEFLLYLINFISHPVLLKRIDTLKMQHQD